MKKIFYITISLLGIIFMNSCVVEDADHYYSRIPIAQDVYRFNATGLTNHVNILDLATKIDLYANASETDRVAIKKYYFDGYTITQKDEVTWNAKSETIQLVLTGNGKPLTETGAQCVVTASILVGLSEKSTAVNIKNIGDDKLSLKTQDFPFTMAHLPYSNPYYESGFSILSSANLIVKVNKASTESPGLNDYVIDSGMYKLDGYLTTSLSFTNTLLFVNTDNNPLSSRLDEGEFSIGIEKPEGYGNVHVRITPEIYNPKVMLTMDGITEEYLYYYW